MPNFENFDPTHIAYQDQVIDDIQCQYDYGLGVHEILLSGAVGSAKSILGAWCGISNCIRYPKSYGLLSRHSLPDLRETIFKKCLELIEGCNVAHAVKRINQTSCNIEFINGSKIISRTCADKLYTKVRSLELSWAIIEEAIELDDDDKAFAREIKMRLGRCQGIPENWLMYITNPDSPAHWLYEYFDLGLDEGTGETSTARNKTKHVYYSKTDDNVFLPASYRQQLKTDYDEKMYQRMGLGRWVEITKDVIYYAYSPKEQYQTGIQYQINMQYPIRFSWDFNIGAGKPMSLIAFQFIDDTMHIFAEVVIEGMRTEDSCDELAARGLLDFNVPKFIVHGDATGKSKDTRSKKSDYDIIRKFFSNYRGGLPFEIDVPLANPAIRKRHNKVNAYCLNVNGQIRLFIYKGCKIADKGLRLTELKPGGQYIENDSKPWQHISTAIGYGLLSAVNDQQRKPQATVQL